MQRIISFFILIFSLTACGTVAPTPVPAVETTLGTEPEIATGTLDVGEQVPAFSFVIEGERRSLSDYQGKHVIVNFWETTCLPCRREMPDFQALMTERSDLVILAVNRRERAELVEQFGKQYGLTFPLILDRTGDISEAFGVTSAIPASFFIDKTGMLTRIQIGVITKAQMRRLLDATSESAE